MKATEVPGRLDSPLSDGLGITATKENEMTDHELIDRKLLEAAARAGKIPVHEWYVSGASILPIEGWPGKSWWNPLTDDGDAFRLAVTLKMGVDITGNAAWAMVENDLHAGYLAAIGSDSFAAARRAIVRAAAAMAAI